MVPDIKVTITPTPVVKTVVSNGEELQVNLQDIILHGGGIGSQGVSINEMLVGIDGTKTIFQASHNFASLLVGVYLNGLKLCQADYSVVPPDEIHLTEAPLPGDILEIDYIK